MTLSKAIRFKRLREIHVLLKGSKNLYYEQKGSQHQTFSTGRACIETKDNIVCPVHSQQQSDKVIIQKSE